MAFKYSLAQLTCLNATPVELAKMAAVAGYDSVSIRQIYMGLPNENRYEMIKDKGMLAEFKSVMTDTGITVGDVELARILEKTPIDEYEPVFELTAELGCKDILGSVWTNDLTGAVETAAAVAERAEKYGLYFNLEYVPVSAIKSLSGMLDFIKRIDRPNVKLMVDVHHFHRAYDNPADLAAVPAEYFRMVHLCDVPKLPAYDRDEMTRIMREDRAYVGEGVADTANILNAMPAGLLYSIELPNAARVAEVGYEGHAKCCLETCKAFVEANVTGRA